ncbi:MAG: two-component regulator propeller domain-containing protein [Bacteroidota bacterium]
MNNPFIKFLICFALLAGLPLIVFGQYQGYEFEHISAKHGLPHGRVSDIIEDQNGFLWFATQEGIFRYDGYEFKAFRHDIRDSTTLSHPYVRCVFEDSKGNIWAGTTYGLNLLDQVTGKFQRFMPNAEIGRKSKIANITHDILEDRNGNIWVCTNRGLHRLLPESKSFATYTIQPEEPTLVREITASDDGTIWASTAYGVARLDHIDSSLIAVPLTQVNMPESRIGVGELTEIRPGEFYMGSTKGLLYFSSRSATITPVFPDQPDLNKVIQEVAIDKNGRVWVTVYGQGLLSFDPKDKSDFILFEHNQNKENSLINNNIRTLHADRFGNIWIGASNGICKLMITNSGFRHLKNEFRIGHKSNRILRILQDEDNTIWTKTSDGLYIRKPGQEKGQKVKIHENVSENAIINAFIQDVDDNLWIHVSRVGFFKRSPEKESFVPVNVDEELAKALVYKIEVDINDDDFFWVATSKGFCKFNRKTFENKWYLPKEQIDEIPNNKVAVFSQGINDMIWLYYTYYNSLGSLDKNTGEFRIYKPAGEQHSALQGDISDIEVDHNGKVWLSTLYGLTYFDVETLEFGTYTKFDGLAENELTIVQEDLNGNLWVCGNRAVSHFDQATETFTEYKLSADVRNFLNKSKAIGRGGEVFLGGVNGFFVFHPDNLQTNNQQPNIVLRDFKVWNDSYPLGKELDEVDQIILSHDENNITFEFSALHYINPDANLYKCILEGYDKEWHDLEHDRKATYTNLNHGNYTFKVSASNSDGIWNEEGLAIGLIITPAIWETAWFRVMVLIVILAIAYAIFRNWQQKIKLRRQKQLAEQATEYKTRFLANVSHEIRTPMNAIIGLSKLTLDTALDEKQHKFVRTISKSSTNLLKIINDLLDFSKLESGKFTFTNAPFNLYEVVTEVEDILKTKAEAKGLQLEVVVDEKTPHGLNGDAIRLSQILINLIGNGIKFSEKGKVWLHVSPQKTGNNNVAIRFEVGDTGIGIPENKLEEIFEDYSQADETTFSQFGGTGLGLSISMQLVEKQGGQLNIESQQGSGTKLWFTLDYETVELETESKAALIPKFDFGPISVLIVEDNQFNQLLALEFLKIHLPEASFEIAENGEVAVNMVKEKEFDTILMDIKMPVMNGYDAALTIRSLADDKRHIPIIGLTANATPEQFDKCIKAGMQDVVIKPFDGKDLLEKMYRFTKVNLK